MRPEARGLASAAHERANRSRSAKPIQAAPQPDTAHTFRPEALGSPASYAVSPDQCLLWPHPSLSHPSAPLCIRKRILLPTGLRRAGNERVPTFIPVTVLPCRLPYPGGLNGCMRLLLDRSHWPSPLWQSLGIHSATERRFSRGQANEAAKFA
jgi:hypothetical protein